MLGVGAFLVHTSWGSVGIPHQFFFEKVAALRLDLVGFGNYRIVGNFRQGKISPNPDV